MAKTSEKITKEKILSWAVGSLVTAIVGGVVGAVGVVGADHIALQKYIEKTDKLITDVQAHVIDTSNDRKEMEKKYIAKEVYDLDIGTIKTNLQTLINLHTGKKGE